MNRSTRTKLAVAMLATAGAFASAAADAAPAHVQVQVQLPGPPAGYATVQGQPVAVYGQPQPVYRQPQAVYGRPQAVYAQPAIVPVQAACAAPRWDPRVRYMPGQVVRRHGDLWVARRVSARVYNENSPPEWTPRYWAQAVCR